MLGSIPPLVELPGQKHIPPDHEAIFAPAGQQKPESIPKSGNFSLAQRTDAVRSTDGKQLQGYPSNWLSIFKHQKISKEALHSMQESATEYILFVLGEYLSIF